MKKRACPFISLKSAFRYVENVETSKRHTYIHLPALQTPRMKISSILFSTLLTSKMIQFKKVVYKDFYVRSVHIPSTDAYGICIRVHDVIDFPSPSFHPRYTRVKALTVLYFLWIECLGRSWQDQLCVTVLIPCIDESGTLMPFTSNRSRMEKNSINLYE